MENNTSKSYGAFVTVLVVMSVVTVKMAFLHAAELLLLLLITVPAVVVMAYSGNDSDAQQKSRSN